ncbi:chemotaxis protein CheD [Dethiobacter alkaliphilus]|uniref:Probable chemoreceptor glutamine deamidase CheD n=1 Tax=Dethiobacter alkaliphilus AHT 1 TaxID=555088 RepID=C0GJE4_DETAL|nr:chemotaxis protein CheD [Dethiobacter alkaliphilus]EEG76491.1 CheD [Dethiobacter alkaliphilus AHT 1]
MNTQSIRVKIADYAALKEEGMLITVGLGSCVGVALYDSSAKVAGLAHILLSDSSLFKNQSNPGKFADTALPLLLEDMARFGARPNRIKAKIAGGSQLFSFENKTLSVGEKNIASVRSVLAGLRVPITSEDVGGSVGRTMKVMAADGTVLVSTVGNGEREL